MLDNEQSGWNVNTATPIDTIAHAIKCHPQAMIAQLQQDAEGHMQALDKSGMSRLACISACALYDTCTAAATAIRGGVPSRIKLDTIGALVPVLSAAFSVLAIPRDTQKEIVARL